MFVEIKQKDGQIFGVSPGCGCCESEDPIDQAMVEEYIAELRSALEKAERLLREMQYFRDHWKEV